MMKTVLTAPYTFVHQEAEIPEISEDQVLLKISQIGVCASDMQMYHGLHKYMTYPVVVGHEVSAAVTRVGARVQGFRPGDNVTVEPQVTCGQCYPCRIGRFNVCEHLKVLGVHKDGFACGYFAIEPKYLHLCEGLSRDQTTLIEPLAVGIGSARRAGDLHGKNVAVVGAGTIGNLVAQSCKALGAHKVMVTDIKDKKLRYALECGIDYAVNTGAKSLKAAVEETFGAQKADVLIDCAATKFSFSSILEAARPASAIVITGNFKAPVELELPILQRQEISLLGHMMYVYEDFQEAIKAVQSGRVNLEGFATQHFRLDEIDEAFRFVDSHPDDVMKAMIQVEG